jgi:hypothetical protein
MHVIGDSVKWATFVPFSFIFGLLHSNADVAKLADTLDLGSETACDATEKPQTILTVSVRSCSPTAQLFPSDTRQIRDSGRARAGWTPNCAAAKCGTTAGATCTPSVPVRASWCDEFEVRAVAAELAARMLEVHVPGRNARLSEVPGSRYRSPF